MAEIHRGNEKNGEQLAAAASGPPLELHNPSAAAKKQAVKDLATSDDKMVKSRLLPPLPELPAAEVPVNGTEVKSFDANQRVVSETVSVAKTESGSTNVKQVKQLDESGAATSLDTTWTDSKGKQHEVVVGHGVTINTIKSGLNFEKLTTRADGSWEHDVENGKTEKITKVEKDKTFSLTQRDLKTGASHESVTHPNGFTEDIVTRKGFKETQTKDPSGVLRFDATVAEKTADGKVNYHANKRLDHNGAVEFDQSHWRDKDGVYHLDDTFNYEDHSSVHTVTTGDTSTITTTPRDGKPSVAIVKSDSQPDATDPPPTPKK
jgi:hypothetical protein